MTTKPLLVVRGVWVAGVGASTAVTWGVSERFGLDCAAAIGVVLRAVVVATVLVRHRR